MKTQPQVALHAVVLVLLLALSSYSAGLAAAFLTYLQEAEGLSASTLLLALIWFGPAVLLACAYPFRRRLEAGPGGQPLLVLHAVILGYCGFWLAEPFDTREGISFILVILLAAASTLAFLTTGFPMLSKRHIPVQAARGQVTLNDSGEKVAGPAPE